MATVRQRKNGTFELRVVHRALPKAYYTTHDSENDAHRYAERLVAALDRGEVPPELRQAPAGRQTPASQALRAYLKDAPIAASDRPMVEHLQETLDVTIEGVTVRWTDAWVAKMKEQRLAPGTIRKKVESLARAIDWWQRRQHEADEIPANPLRTLPRGYSAYAEGDAPAGEAPVDVQRDRRLLPGEEARVEAVIRGAKGPGRQRALSLPHRDRFLLLWRLVVATGLRLREAYRLRPEDVRFDLRTIHVPKSKTGRARDVPMTKQVHDWLSEAQPFDSLIFPFWDGTPDDLPRATSRLSQTFARVFEHAECEDLTEHDLRHEATCRWMLMKDEAGRWTFRPEEVRRITGHKNVQQFERYLSLRGSDLAERLW